MSRHRRPRRIGWLVTRRRYLELMARYESLLADYIVQGADLQKVLEDHEGLLYGLQTDAEPLADTAPQPVVPQPQRVPSWAETEPLPAVAEPMPPSVAADLVSKAGLLEDPGGVTSGKNG